MHLSTLLTLTLLAHTTSSSAQPLDVRARGRHYARMLAERLLPITATTTVTVEMTSTHTVWEMATAQAVYAPGGGESSSSTSEPTVSATITSSAVSSMITESAYHSANATSTGAANMTSVFSDAEYSPSVTQNSSSAAPTNITTTATSSSSMAPDAWITPAPSDIFSAGPMNSSTYITAWPTDSNSTSSVANATASMTASATSTGSMVPTASASYSEESYNISSSVTVTFSSTMPNLTPSSTSASTSASSSSSSSSSSPAPSATSGSTGRTTRSLPTRMMAAYYPDWTSGQLPPSAIDWSKIDCADLAFAIPDENFALQFTMWNSVTTLTNLVAEAHANGKYARLSIGGWTGSVYFSSAMSSASNRQTFVNNIAATYASFGLDGIDIDWEYPGTQGAGNNGVSSSDAANFLLFFQLLRATLPSDAILSAATQVWPFVSSSGAPMTDVSGFAAVLDWVLVMNYDIWGSSTNPGPNAPLSNACNNSTQPLANAYAAVSSWTSAGMSANQIMLGVPAYGYLQKSTTNSLKQRRSMGPRAAVTIYNSNGGSTDGQIDFADLVSQGALTLNWNGEYVGGGGFTREWDSCSSTPWLKSTASGQVITYDDPDSLSLKAQFARQAGLRGVNMWEMNGDTDDWALTTALRSGLAI